MNLFKRARVVALGMLLLPLGSLNTRADNDQESSDDQAVTAETRHQIVETLLGIVGNDEEKAEVRASAARSLGARASTTDAVNAEVREELLNVVKSKEADAKLQMAAVDALGAGGFQLTEEQLSGIRERLRDIANSENGVDIRAAAVQRLGVRLSNDERDTTKIRQELMRILENEDAEPRLQIAAADAFRMAGFPLTREQLEVVGGRLWEIAIEYAFNESVNKRENAESLRIAFYAVSQLNDYARAGHLMPPRDVSAVYALLAIRDSERVPDGHDSYRAHICTETLERLQDSDDGVRLLIEAIGSGDESSDHRKELLRLVDDVVPETEGIARELVKAAQSGDPDLQEGAIEALGNEVRRRGPRHRPVSVR